MKYFFILLVFLQTGCSIDSNLSIVDSKSVDVSDDVPISGTSADIIYGEKVITTIGTPGYQFQADFYESAETKTLSNNYKIEAIFQ